MTAIIAGGVDCDLHPAVPHLTSLLPYMNDYWRDQVTTRGMVDLVSQSYPANSPISSLPETDMSTSRLPLLISLTALIKRDVRRRKRVRKTII